MDVRPSLSSSSAPADGEIQRRRGQTFSSFSTPSEAERIMNQKELLQENPSKSDRITFHGSPIRDLKKGNLVVVSFPGAHGLAWNSLVQEYEDNLYFST